MSKQTILGRVAQLAKANVDALLDQAEDPQKMIDQLIRQYGANISEAEDAVSASLRNLRLTQHDHAEDVAAAAEWGGKAVASSRQADELRAGGNTTMADRFDSLARVALGRQLESEREAGIAGPAIASQSELVETLRAGLVRMKRKLSRLQSRRDELVAHSRSAPAREQRSDTATSVDVLDPTDELARFVAKVRREETRAAGNQELAPSSLDGQFESLDTPSDSTEVDARLSRLKRGSS